MFMKPATSLAAYNQDIVVPKIAQTSTDYEGELVRSLTKNSTSLES